MLTLAACLPGVFAGRAADPEPPRDWETLKLKLLMFGCIGLASLIFWTAVYSS